MDERPRPESCLMKTSQHDLLNIQTPPMKLRAVLQYASLMCADVLAFMLSGAAGLLGALDVNTSFKARLTEPGQGLQLSIYLALVMAWLMWFGLVKYPYTRRTSFWTELWEIETGVLTFIVLNLALFSMVDATHREFNLTHLALALLFFLPTARHLSRALLRRLHLWEIPTIIIGNGENAKAAYLALKSEPAMGFVVKGFVLPMTQSHSTTETVHSPVEGLPAVPLHRQAEDVLKLRNFHCVIALEAEQKKMRDAVIRLLSQHRIPKVNVIPAVRGIPLSGMETTHFFSHEVMLIQLRNNLANPLHRLCKRVFDVVGSITLLLLLSPVFMVLTYKISKYGGQPFYGHGRIGQGGQSFSCHKFRSMAVNSHELLAQLLATDPVARQEWRKDFKLKNDPRISRLGHFMRRTSLDELPQLWNVLKGEMSLVGPRPVVQAELERYGEDVDYYLMAKPGITGLWQVSGRNDVDYSTRVYLDAWYVKNWSLWSDIVILFKTISAVSKRSGAY